MSILLLFCIIINYFSNSPIIQTINLECLQRIYALINICLIMFFTFEGIYLEILFLISSMCIKNIISFFKIIFIPAFFIAFSKEFPLSYSFKNLILSLVISVGLCNCFSVFNSSSIGLESQYM